MRSALQCLLLFSALWTLSLCGTRQFHVVHIQKNWTEAQKYCREIFTDLATIDSQEQMDAVKAAINGASGHYWMGLRQKPGVGSTVNSIKSSTSWIWSDGSTVTYVNWQTGQPDSVGEFCGQVYSEISFQWNDIGCQWANQFICHEDIPLILIKQVKTWREALSYCREINMDLVSVHNQTIQRWVEIITENAVTDNVWIGLRYTGPLSFWFWVSGESICYQNWAPGNGAEVEDTSGGERSGAVQTKSKQWVSLPETQKLYFICSISEGRTEGY